MLIAGDQVAPPHLPCGPNEQGGTYELVPHLWWINQGPDLKATVEFEVAGEHISYSGIGYQDKVGPSQSLQMATRANNLELGGSATSRDPRPMVLGPCPRW